MKLHKIRAFVVSTCTISFLLLAGCNEPIRNELNYRAILPSSYAPGSRGFASAFGAQLAASAGLVFVEETPLTGIETKDKTYWVTYRANGKQELRLTIMTDGEVFSVTIDGDVKSVEATTLGQQATMLFASKLPGTPLLPYVARRGWLGP